MSIVYQFPTLLTEALLKLLIILLKRIILILSVLSLYLLIQKKGTDMKINRKHITFVLDRFFLVENGLQGRLSGAHGKMFFEPHGEIEPKRAYIRN